MKEEKKLYCVFCDREVDNDIQYCSRCKEYGNVRESTEEEDED